MSRYQEKLREALKRFKNEDGIIELDKDQFGEIVRECAEAAAAEEADE